MFVVEDGSIVTTFLLVRDLVQGGQNLLFNVQITLWLWFTVLFANFAEAMAEGRGKAQADALRRTKPETVARRIVGGRRDAGVEERGREFGGAVRLELLLVAESDDASRLGVRQAISKSLHEEAANLLKVADQISPGAFAAGSVQLKVDRCDFEPRVALGARGGYGCGEQ